MEDSNMEIYLDNESYDRDREMEMDAETYKKMTNDEVQELVRLKQEVSDAEKVLKNDREAFRNAEKWVKSSDAKLTWAKGALWSYQNKLKNNE